MRWVLVVAAVSLLLAAGSAGAAALIDGGDVKNSSLTGKDVRDRSLTKRDFRGSVRGPRGVQGAQGVPGPQGPPGPTVVGQITTVSGSAAIAPNDFNIAAAACPPGQRVISGGATTITGQGGTWTDRASDDRTAWLAGGEDLSGTGGTVTAYAYCVPAGQAVAASRRTYRSEVSTLRQARAAHR